MSANQSLHPTAAVSWLSGHAVSPAAAAGELFRSAVESNVRWTMKQLAELPEANKAVDKKIKMVGGVYDLDSGKLRMLR